MTRSYNCRKGANKNRRGDCDCPRCNMKEYHERMARKKRSTKYNVLKFYDTFFEHKRKINHKRKWGYDDCKINYTSYSTWTWLKGKPNQKGWVPSRYRVYTVINDLFVDGRYYSPRQ